MSILLSGKSRVLIQGLTGREGSFHTEAMKAYGTNIVGGVSPGKGGSTSLGVPVFDTVADARRATDADVSGIFVPAPFAADAIMEAAAAGLELIVCITEGIPLHDMVRARAFVAECGARLIGHAGAIISGNKGTAQSKLDSLRKAGARVCETIEEVVDATRDLVGVAQAS